VACGAVDKADCYTESAKRNDCYRIAAWERTPGGLEQLVRL